MSIFLTGATGFLGGKLLKNLLASTSEEIYLLFRSQKKFDATLAQLPTREIHRIHAVQGDITQPLFGLSEQALEQLTNQVTYLYHLAALVKFDEELRDEIFLTNYTGTEHALTFAERIGVQHFYYVSTAYTVGKELHGKEQLYPLEQLAHNPYEASKVQSEHLVFHHEGTFTTSIFRPSIIVGDSETGEADSSFTLYGFMRALDVFHRRVSRSVEKQDVYRVIADRTATSNLVPVNYVADILGEAVHFAKPNTIYHITNPEPENNEEILTLIKETLSFNELVIVEQDVTPPLTREEIQLNKMIDVFFAYLSSSFTFDDQNTQTLLQQAGLKHLQMDDVILRRIIEAYYKTV